MTTSNEHNNAHAVPQGWKLVPVEPTKEMIDAYCEANGRFQSARADWAAMLAATPSPAPAQEPAPTWSLREALQKAKDALSLALSDVDWRKDSPTQPVIHKAYNCARQALALPTAEQVDDINVAESFTSVTKTAAPVGERDRFEQFAQNCPMGKYNVARRGEGYDSSHTQIMWDAWQARAALNAGDAVDAQRWKTSELISRAALTHPDKRTEQMNIAFNAYRKAMESGQSYAACVDAAIDAAMRKGQL